MHIIGIDFSGARGYKKVGKTWLAQGELVDNALTLKSCCPISRADLTTKLAELPEPAVAAMDFPFSVPVEFARFWRPDARQMPDLWAAAADMKLPGLWAKAADKKLSAETFADLELADFMAWRDGFVAKQGEMKRLGDKPIKESFSPLKRVGINMVPMLFRGMQLLHSLWASSTPNNLLVKPYLYRPGTGQNATTLLEVMPGATLRRLGLYREGCKTGSDAPNLRLKILKDLRQPTKWLKVEMSTVPNLTADCQKSDDALDSVVAAITAALWHIDQSRGKSLFCYPPNPGQTNYNQVQLEGWLYAPKPIGKKQ